MDRRPPRLTLTDPLLPATTLFRSGDRPLHVAHAAPIKQAALDSRGERIGRPAIARRHDIAMAGKGEMRPALAAHREQILDRAIGWSARAEAVNGEEIGRAHV